MGASPSPRAHRQRSGATPGLAVLRNSGLAGHQVAPFGESGSIAVEAMTRPKGARNDPGSFMPWLVFDGSATVTQEQMKLTLTTAPPGCRCPKSATRGPPPTPPRPRPGEDRPALSPPPTRRQQHDSRPPPPPASPGRAHGRQPRRRPSGPSTPAAAGPADPADRRPRNATDPRTSRTRGWRTRARPHRPCAQRRCGSPPPPQIHWTSTPPLTHGTNARNGSRLSPACKRAPPHTSVLLRKCRGTQLVSGSQPVKRPL